MQSQPTNPTPWSEVAKSAFWIVVIMLASAALSFGYLWYAFDGSSRMEHSADVSRPVLPAIR